jgi:hypothetical protein
MKRIAFAVFVAIISTRLVFAQCELTHVKDILQGGDTFGVIKHGNYAYVMGDEGVMAYSLSDSGAPVFVKTMETSFGQSSIFKGDTLFGGYGNLKILDFTDPLNPVQISEYVYSGGYVSDIAIEGNYAFLGISNFYYENWFEVIDISDPANPTFVFADSVRRMSSLDAVGNHLLVTYYWVEGPWSVLYYDISNPSHPVFRNEIDMALYPRDVAIYGDYAYIIGEDRVGVIRVNESDQIENIGYIDSLSYYKIQISDDYAYLTGGTKLSILDLSNPAEPVLTRTNQSCFYLSKEGESAVCLGYENSVESLIKLDMSDPTVPIDVGSRELPDVSRDLAISGDYLYVANGYSGLRCLSIADIEHPVEESLMPLDGNCNNVVLSGNYAFTVSISGYSCQIDISDISAPNNPNQIGSFNISTHSAWMNDMAISGNYVYAAMYTNSLDYLYIADISNPSQPQHICDYAVSSDIYCIKIKDNLAYVNGRDSLFILDISNPQSISRVGCCRLLTTSARLDLGGNYAYIACQDSGLSVYDISNPQQPEYAGSLGIGTAGKVTVNGNVAYIDYGVKAIDISDPIHPVLKCSDSTIYAYSRIAVKDNYIFVSEENHIAVLRMTPTGIENEVGMPVSYSLKQNYPNPFNSSTSISYAIPAGQQSTINIYDICGRNVRAIPIKGSGNIVWNGRDNVDKPVSSGIYFYSIAGQLEQARKMLLVK